MQSKCEHGTMNFVFDSAQTPIPDIFDMAH